MRYICQYLLDMYYLFSYFLVAEREESPTALQG